MKRIFIAGAPRTGSMWTYNVTRALLQASGKTFLPRENPITPEAIERILREAYSPETPENTVYCLKFHEYLPDDLPETKIITNYRDTRDTMISFIRFTKFDKKPNLFERAKKILLSHMRLTDFYFEHHKGNLRIRFSDIENDPVSIIKEINGFLGLNVGDAQIEKIKIRYAKENVRKLIEKLDNVAVSPQGLIHNAENASSYQALLNADGSFRVRDRETHFQTNHITSKKGGEWKEYFTVQEQQEINTLVAGWLKKYNFPL